MSNKNSLLDYTLRLADDALIIGHRLSEWCGHGPILEQDIAITNTALDHLGRARSLFQYAADQFNSLPVEAKKDVFTSVSLQTKIASGGAIGEDDLASLHVPAHAATPQSARSAASTAVELGDPARWGGGSTVSLHIPAPTLQRRATAASVAVVVPSPLASLDDLVRQSQQGAFDALDGQTGESTAGRAPSVVDAGDVAAAAAAAALAAQALADAVGQDGGGKGDDDDGNADGGGGGAAEGPGGAPQWRSSNETACCWAPSWGRCSAC